MTLPTIVRFESDLGLWNRSQGTNVVFLWHEEENYSNVILDLKPVLFAFHRYCETTKDDVGLKEFAVF